MIAVKLRNMLDCTEGLGALLRLQVPMVTAKKIKSISDIIKKETSEFYEVTNKRLGELAKTYDEKGLPVLNKTDGDVYDVFISERDALLENEIEIPFEKIKSSELIPSDTDVKKFCIQPIILMHCDWFID